MSTSPGPLSCALGALGALLVLAGLAAAQPAAPQPGRPQPAGPQTGRIDAVVFAPNGRPVPGVTLRVGEVEARTGRDGIARLVVPAGQQRLELRRGGALLGALSVPVAWGEVTEVILRLSPAGPPEADVEAPGWPRSERALPSATVHYGKVRGRALDARTQRPVSRVRVLARGQVGEAQSDAEGRYELVLPAGTHTLAFVHAEHATATRPDVVVPPSGEVTLEVELTPSSVQLEAVKVSGYQLAGGLAALLEDRRERRAVSEVLGAEQIGKSGDGDAAAALRRVTGLSVVDGKYVYVRGMGQRYSNTLLNGSTLPSPEPERRVVPLDLFPTNVIESITIQKTYSPELPGEFGGGTVLLRTSAIPEGFFLKGSLSGGYKDGTSFERGLSYRGSPTDWLGYDDGTRSLPWPVQVATEGGRQLALQDPISGEGYPIEVLEVLGEQMPNVWSTRRAQVRPDLGLSLAVGDRYTVADRPLGFRAGVTYGNDFQLQRGTLRALGLGAGGELTRIVDYRTESLTNTVDFSSLLTVGFEPAKGHELNVTGLWLRRTEDQTQVYQGLLANDDAQIRVTSLSFIEQQLLTTQVGGKHLLGDLVQARWSYTWAEASRWQPDSRRTRFDLDDPTGRYLLSTRPEGNQRLFNELTDENHDLEAALEAPFVLREEVLTGSLQAGASLILRDREAGTRRFKFIHRGPRSNDLSVLAQAPEQIFSPQNIGADGFSFEEITRATDSYEAEQTVSAGFVRLDLSLYERLDLSLGLRVERSRQEVRTFNLFDRAGGTQTAELAATDYLPALNVAFHLSETMQLRLGYGRTLARPDFRELSLAPFDQVVGAGVFVGNRDLQRTRIDHLDLRWEWYPSSDETVSVGLFYKRLQDPIETVVLGGSNRTITLANADQGENMGVELEFRRRLSFLGGIGERLFCAGNVALIRSRVELGRTGIATSRKRPLEGQSEYVVNLSCGYDDPERRISVALLYNVSGERIVGIGTLGLPDVYEQPFHQLDFVASWGFWEHWSVKLSLGNLLDGEVRLTQGGETVQSYRKGRSVGLSLTAEF
ncbi:MAG: TonB-dependent receptor [Planctomycetota bacterium]